MKVEATVDVVGDTARAQVLLHPTRLALLASLETEGSAADLGRRLDLPRQRVGYHLRELESEHLIEVAEERQRGSVIERVYRRSASAYAISSAALGSVGSTTEGLEDRFSAAYQVALASRAVEDLGRLQVGARKAGKQLPTLALESEVRFASPRQRHAFAVELLAAVEGLVAKYHDAGAPAGRSFRFYAGAYPEPK